MKTLKLRVRLAGKMFFGWERARVHAHARAHAHRQLEIICKPSAEASPRTMIF